MKRRTLLASLVGGSIIGGSLGIGLSSASIGEDDEEWATKPYGEIKNIQEDIPSDIEVGPRSHTVAGDYIAVGSRDDNEIILFDRNWEEVNRKGVYDAAPIAESNGNIIITEENDIKMYEVPNFEEVWSYPRGSSVPVFGTSDNIVAFGEDNEVTWLESETGDLIHNDTLSSDLSTETTSVHGNYVSFGISGDIGADNSHIHIYTQDGENVIRGDGSYYEGDGDFFPANPTRSVGNGEFLYGKTSTNRHIVKYEIDMDNNDLIYHLESDELSDDTTWLIAQNNEKVYYATRFTERLEEVDKETGDTRTTIPSVSTPRSGQYIGNEIHMRLSDSNYVVYDYVSKGLFENGSNMTSDNFTVRTSTEKTDIFDENRWKFELDPGEYKFELVGEHETETGTIELVHDSQTETVGDDEILDETMILTAGELETSDKIYYNRESLKTNTLLGTENGTISYEIEGN